MQMNVGKSCTHVCKKCFSFLLDKPRLKLSIGRGLDRHAIKEGIDVYFTCQVTANPAYESLQFFRDVSMNQNP